MIQVGTILSGAYSYSARIPVFFRVVRLTDKTVWLEQLNKFIVDDDGYGQNGSCMPDLVAPGKLIEKGFRIKRRSNGTIMVKYDIGCWLYVWDYKPEIFYSD